jgi:DpnII restriction endonuclease/uncharacterized protein DUF2321
MTHVIEASGQDVMQVCCNGHVITDRLHACPEAGRNRCERCGAATLDRCATCGWELPGTVFVPGLMPVGSRQPPKFCAMCGAAFPWAMRRRPPAAGAHSQLENLLRRSPLVIRQLRSRHGRRPAFRVEDTHDLEDLLRALLPLYFDDIRPEGRTPPYAETTRTDLLIAPQRLALTIKYARSTVSAAQIKEQLREDAAYWRGQRNCRTLIAFLYDAEAVLREPAALEAAWSNQDDSLDVRCIIAAP